MTRCKQCKGTDVQVVNWTNPNANTVVDGEPPWSSYASAASQGHTWCADCDDHTELEDVEDKA